jgi:hypothetical protein
MNYIIVQIHKMFNEPEKTKFVYKYDLKEYVTLAPAL